MEYTLAMDDHLLKVFTISKEEGWAKAARLLSKTFYACIILRISRALPSLKLWVLKIRRFCNNWRVWILRDRLPKSWSGEHVIRFC